MVPGSPSAIFSPKFSTRMRSLICITARMSCSTSSTVTPRSRMPRTISTAPLGLFRVHPGERLIQQQSLGLSRHGDRDAEARADNRAASCGDLVLDAAEAEIVEDLGGARAKRRLVGACHARVEEDRRGRPAAQMMRHHHVLGRCHLAEDGGFLEGAHHTPRRNDVGPRSGSPPGPGRPRDRHSAAGMR